LPSAGADRKTMTTFAPDGRRAQRKRVNTGGEKKGRKARKRNVETY